MLRLFGPGCSNVPVDAKTALDGAQKAVWIDLLEPTREEEALAETLIGADIPTRAEMQEIGARAPGRWADRRRSQRACTPHRDPADGSVDARDDERLLAPGGHGG